MKKILIIFLILVSFLYSATLTDVHGDLSYLKRSSSYCYKNLGFQSLYDSGNSCNYTSNFQSINSTTAKFNICNSYGISGYNISYYNIQQVSNDFCLPCPTGQHMDDNAVCVDDVPTCPTGQHLENDICVEDCDGINKFQNGVSCIDCSMYQTSVDVATCVCSALGSSYKSTPTISIQVQDNDFIYTSTIELCNNGVNITTLTMPYPLNPIETNLTILNNNNDLNYTIPNIQDNNTSNLEPILQQNALVSQKNHNDLKNIATKQDVTNIKLDLTNNKLSSIDNKLSGINSNIRSGNNQNLGVLNDINSKLGQIRDKNTTGDDKVYDYITQDVTSAMQNEKDKNISVDITPLNNVITSAFANQTQDWITKPSNCGTFHLDNINMNILGGNTHMDMSITNDFMNSSAVDTLYNLIKILLYFTSAFGAFKVFTKAS